MVKTLTLKALIERHNDCLDEIQEIEEAAAASDDGVMTDEQLDKYNELTEEADELEAKIEKRKAAEKTLAKNKQRKRISAPSNRKTSAGDGASLGSTVHENFEDDPKKGFKSPREFMMAVMEVGQGRAKPDARLQYLAAAGSDEQSGSDDPYGGFLVPEGFSPNMLQVDPEADPTAGRTTNVPMDVPTVNIPARTDKNHSTSVSGGLTVSRRTQTQAGTSSRMEMEKVRMHATSLFGLAYATEELLTDSPVSFAAILSAGFSDQFNYHLLNEKLNGTGTGEFEGVLNTPCKIEVAKESGQAADTIVKENVFKMRSRCWGYGMAIWLANHDCLPELLDLNDSNHNIWNPSLQEDRPDMLLGRPIFFSEFPNTIGDAGDLILGNWSQYLEGTLESLDSAESIHVRFENHERTFKFWTRNDGRCWWRSALTPKNGSTLSPFVTLAERA